MQHLLATHPLLFYTLLIQGLLVLLLPYLAAVLSMRIRPQHLVLLLLIYGAELFGLALLDLVRPQRSMQRVPVAFSKLAPPEQPGTTSEVINYRVLLADGHIHVLRDSEMVLMLREDEGRLHRLSVPALGKSVTLLPNHTVAISIPEGSQALLEGAALQCQGGVSHDAHTIPLQGRPSGECAHLFREKLELGLLSTKGCTGCHSADGSELAGPSFKGLWGSERVLGGERVVVDDAYIRAVLQEPPLATCRLGEEWRVEQAVAAIEALK